MHMIAVPDMSSNAKHSPSRIGFLLRLVGLLALLGGQITYSILLRRMQSGVPGAQGAFGTATPLVIAAIVANLGGVVLMVGLAALRDRVAYRISGLALAVLLIMLDMPALDALTGPNVARAIALGIGALFLVVPWIFPRARRGKSS